MKTIGMGASSKATENKDTSQLKEQVKALKAENKDLKAENKALNEELEAFKNPKE